MLEDTTIPAGLRETGSFSEQFAWIHRETRRLIGEMQEMQVEIDRSRDKNRKRLANIEASLARLCAQ